MNRRHLTEGQKAVLANNYSTILSKKRESEAGKKAVTIREIKKGNIDVETVSSSMNEEQERSRKIASERWKVSEWNVRIAQEIQKKAPKVYEKLGSGDLQIHEAKIIAQLPKTVQRRRYPMLMAILFVATMAILAAILVMLVPGLSPGIIRGLESVLHVMREPPFPVTGFTVHYFSRDSRGHASMLRRVRI